MKIFIFLITAILSFATASVSYTSIHQFADNKGDISVKNQFLNAVDMITISSPDFLYRAQYRIYPCNQNGCSEWYAQDWMRYRLYIPTGLVNSVNILISARQPNASLYAMVYFIPDESMVETVDFNNYKNQYIVSGWNTIDVGERYLLQGYTPVLYKVENIKRIELDNISSYTDKSGWLYISLAQSDLVMSSWDGYQSDTKIKISVEYKLSQNIDIQEYFRLKKFTSSGDPIENYSSRKENEKLLNNELVTVEGDHMGEYIFDPDQPVISKNSIVYDNKVTYNIGIKAGQAPLEGIEVNSNHNISLIMSLDECLKIENVISDRGEIFYSSNGEEWNKNFNQEYNFIKVEISDNNSSPVLSQGESFDLNVTAMVNGTCPKTQIVSDVFLKYVLKGEQVDNNFSIKNYISFSTSSSMSIEASSSSDTIGGGVDDWTSVNKRAECEQNGGVWLDTYCEYQSSSFSNSSISSSMSSSLSSIEIDDQENTNGKLECEQNGGVWLDTYCEYPDEKRSSSSSASSLSSKRFLIEDFLDGRKLPVSGYFAYYGNLEDLNLSTKEKAFAWIYASRSGSLVAKLQGLKPDGTFDWEILKSQDKNLFDLIKTDGDYIYFGSPVKAIKSQLEVLNGRTLRVSGYFAYYGNLEDLNLSTKEKAFAWIYASRSGSLVAKLQGLKPDGTFDWEILKGENVNRLRTISVNKEMLEFQKEIGKYSSQSSISSELQTSSSTSNSSVEYASSSSLSSEVSSQSHYESSSVHSQSSSSSQRSKNTAALPPV